MNLVPIDKAAEIAAAKTLPASTEPNPKVDQVKQANLRFFKDAAARIVNRKPAERQKYAETALKEPVLGLFECVLGSISDDLKVFAIAFVNTLAAESQGWDAEKLDEVATTLVERGIQAALERGTN